jgi:hypothetical protein
MGICGGVVPLVRYVHLISFMQSDMKAHDVIRAPDGKNCGTKLEWPGKSGV